MAVIRSKKFILRPVRKGDEDSLIENINDPTVARNTLRIPYPYRMKDARWWIKHNAEINRKKKKTGVNFAIVIKGKVVGNVGLHKIEGHKAEIGFWLGKNYRRQGIMSQAVNLVVKYGFEKLGLKRIYGYSFISNKASAAVFKKTGFKYEGKLRKQFKKDNKLIDVFLFAKVK